MHLCLLSPLLVVYSHFTAVLATCGIRLPVGAFEKAQSRLLLLADSKEEE